MDPFFERTQMSVSKMPELIYWFAVNLTDNHLSNCSNTLISTPAMQVQGQQSDEGQADQQQQQQPDQ